MFVIFVLSLEKCFRLPCSVLDFVSRLMMTFDPSKVCFDHFDLSRITNNTTGSFFAIQIFGKFSIQTNNQLAINKSTNNTTGSFLQIQIIDQSTIKDLKDIDINMYKSSC